MTSASAAVKLTLAIELTDSISKNETHEGRRFAYIFANTKLSNGERIPCERIPSNGSIEKCLLNNIHPCILITIALPGSTLFFKLQYNTIHFALHSVQPTEHMDESNIAQKLYSLLRDGEYNVCIKEGWGDPHNYARGSEIELANILGHKIAKDYSGADAMDDNGLYEYKTTISKNINATYNGISIQNTWDEQVKYLENEKIGKYDHFIARRCGSKFVEIYKLNAKDVLEHLKPKLKKQFIKLKNNQKSRKDARLGASIPKSFIYKHGEKIL